MLLLSLVVFGVAINFGVGIPTRDGDLEVPGVPVDLKTCGLAHGDCYSCLATKGCSYVVADEDEDGGPDPQDPQAIAQCIPTGMKLSDIRSAFEEAPNIHFVANKESCPQVRSKVRSLEAPGTSDSEVTDPSNSSMTTTERDPLPLTTGSDEESSITTTTNATATTSPSDPDITTTTDPDAVTTTASNPNTTTSTGNPNTTTSTIPETTTTDLTTEGNTTTMMTTTATTEPTNATTTTTPSTTTTMPTTTTSALPPTSTPSGRQSGNHFDGWSFFGGILLTLGLFAIGFVGLKYYKVRAGGGTGANYNRF